MIEYNLTMARKSRGRQPSFDPTLSRGIIAIILVVFAAIIVLSFFDQAGPLGFVLNKNILATLFGSIRFTTPFIVLIIAWFFVKDIEYDYRPTHGVGAFLFLVSLASLFHLPLATDEMVQQAILGNGGGIFGLAAWPLKEYLGIIAAGLILFGIFVVSFLLIFNTLIVHFLTVHKALTASLGTIGKKIFGVMQVVSKAKPDEAEEDEYEDGEDYEDEEDEDYEEERFSKKNNKESKKDEEEDEYEDYDEEEPVEKTKNNKKTKSDANTSPTWMQNVIIKDLPPLRLLSNKKGKPTSGDIEANKDIIQETLAEFGIDVDMGDVRVGPTVTQYTLKPRKGVKLSRIIALSNDLALALAAHPIRIEAPIPGKSLVGIEVPNERAALVSFKELLESKHFKGRAHGMMIGLGKDVAGKVWFGDLPRMPHVLIAGATGSGKTVCVNTILMSLLYQNTAETLRMIMVDPKRVELTMYNGIPHLLTPVITNTSKTVNALKWTIGEMDRRFELLSKVGCRNIDSYNKKYPRDRLPHIAFVIDELADLMATAAGEVEAGIIRLAQMARAVGIHLILATQRPSVDVITGLMKANIPARIAFSVASLTDSRTILDSGGAEKLLGRGDMLFQTAELSKPVRVQGALISEEELKNVVDYLKGDEIPEYDDSIVEKQSSGTVNMFGGAGDDQDSLFEEAKNAILEVGKASASFLQRKLKIGYARAARILDELEAAGIIGPADGAKPREILLTEQEIDNTMDSGGELNVYEDGEDQNELDDEEMEGDEDDEEIGNEEIEGNEDDDEEDEEPGDEEMEGDEDLEDDLEEEEEDWNEDEDDEEEKRK
jgi:DNA segregation ATPase FtsK/SpoIIIE, S-DNA-T family